MEERHSSGHWPARRCFETRASCVASASILWQLWLCRFVRLTNSPPHALHADNGKKTTEKPPVRVVNPCRKARSAEPTPTCTAMTATSRKHQCLRLLREYHLLSQWSVSVMRKSDGRIVHADFTSVSFVTNSHQRLTASFAPRDAVLCSLVAVMSGDSPSDWWDSWDWRGEWANSPSPDPTPTEQAPRRAGHKRRPQVTRPTTADSGLDEEEITQNSDGKRHIRLQKGTMHTLPWRLSSWRANGRPRPSVPTT